MSAAFRILGSWFYRLLGRSGHRSSDAFDSIIILYRRDPEFDPQKVQDRFSRALATPRVRLMTPREHPAPDYSAQAPPCRLQPVAARGCVFGVTLAPFPYINPDSLTPDAQDRAMQVLANHKGWIGINIVTGRRPDDPYAVLGTIAAEFLDEASSLVLLPVLSLAGVPTPELADRMRAPDWLEVLEPIETGPPTDIDDEAIKRTRLQARESLPEFIEAFRNREGSEFSAKFAFTRANRVEHLWVAVLEINGQSILGTLGNEPAILTEISEGDPVTRNLVELEDWLYMKNGQMVGGFSVRAALTNQSDDRS